MNAIDLATLHMQTPTGREIVMEDYQDKLILYVPKSKKWGGGRESKKVTVNRFITTNDLFFEGLGLWYGEGSKAKGLYFGNSCLELILHFLKFVETKLGLARTNFKVVMLVPEKKESELNIKTKWAKKLGIPVENFNGICICPKINLEHAMIYINSIVLITLLKNLHKHVKPLIFSSEEFSSAYMRGIFAAEGSAVLKKSGVLFHVDLSAKDPEDVQFYKKCFDRLGIEHGKYMVQDKKFPIYGWRNFKRFRELSIHILHPEKRAKFELGFANYRRMNVLGGEEARALILQQLASGSKTYDDLAAALGKARTTIQAWHLPILERKELVRRVGKRGRAWLFATPEDKISLPPNINRAPCAEPMPC